MRPEEAMLKRGLAGVKLVIKMWTGGERSAEMKE
jgi:hypothetical protein